MSPRISVIISTLNRPDEVAACVRRVLSDPAPDFELVVVDQSDPERHAAAARAAGSDPRLRWIPSRTRGLSVSRNLGLAAVSGELIAFTDDDCAVATDWLATVRAHFAASPTTDLLFGSVVLRPEDRARGYAAEFEPTQPAEFRGAYPDIRKPWGVGANMVMRRELVRVVGAFDPQLGAGARFQAAEETDYTIRALAAGSCAVFAPEVSVTHLGVRVGAEAGRLLRGYGTGLGAMFAKHVRLGTPGVAQLFAGWLAHHGSRSVRNAMRGDRHPGFGLVAAVLLGAARSWAVPIDASGKIYADPALRSGAGT